MKSLLLGAMASVAVLTCGSTASATTIVDDFTFSTGDPGATATGSFSYDSSKTGVLSFSDLESFSVKLYGTTFDKAFVDSLITSPTSSQDYIYFGFNTATDTFTPAVISGYAGSADTILAALGHTPNTGFFFDPLTSSGGDGIFALYQNASRTNYLTPATYSITSRVPEPSSWAMMIMGLAVLGGLARVLRRKTGAAWAATNA